MKAMIFAAGLGTRLRPLTNDRPKALVSVGGKTLLEHTVDRLKQSGITEIVINVHHFAPLMKQFIAEHDNFGVNVYISDESDLLLDTGGGIRHASEFLSGDEPILIHNVDILSNLDLKALEEAHLQYPETLATLVVSQRKTSRYLLFDSQNQLKGWENQSTGQVRTYCPDFNRENLYAVAFAGIHIISPKALELMIPYSSVFSIIDFYLKEAASCRIKAFQPMGLELIDVGKIETLPLAEVFLKNVYTIL